MKRAIKSVYVLGNLAILGFVIWFINQSFWWMDREAAKSRAELPVGTDPSGVNDNYGILGFFGLSAIIIAGFSILMGWASLREKFEKHHISSVVEHPAAGKIATRYSHHSRF